jgi:hypothetical protein
MLRAHKFYRDHGAKWQYSFTALLKLSWQIQKSLCSLKYSKARGTTFLDRQFVLRILSFAERQYVSLFFKRNFNNPFDDNAIKIVANLANKGSHSIGYVSKELASIIAPVIDSGAVPIVFLEEITGSECTNFGANFSYALLKKAPVVGTNHPLTL